MNLVCSIACLCVTRPIDPIGPIGQCAVTEMVGDCVFIVDEKGTATKRQRDEVEVSPILAALGDAVCSTQYPSIEYFRDV